MIRLRVLVCLSVSHLCSSSLHLRLPVLVICVSIFHASVVIVLDTAPDKPRAHRPFKPRSLWAGAGAATCPGMTTAPAPATLTLVAPTTAAGRRVGWEAPVAAPRERARERSLWQSHDVYNKVPWCRCRNENDSAPIGALPNHLEAKLETSNLQKVPVLVGVFVREMLRPEVSTLGTSCQHHKSSQCPFLSFENTQSQPTVKLQRLLSVRRRGIGTLQGKADPEIKAKDKHFFMRLRP